jgi:hypothetical protein
MPKSKTQQIKIIIQILKKAMFFWSFYIVTFVMNVSEW